MDENVPNTFISEDGEVIFINEHQWTEEEKDDIEWCERQCDRVEKKYGTNDVREMMEKNITRQELQRYIDNVRNLMWIYGIKR